MIFTVLIINMMAMMIILNIPDIQENELVKSKSVQF